MADVSGQLKLQQEINDTITERQKLNESVNAGLTRQARLAREINNSMDGENLSNMEERLEGVGQGFDRTARSAAEAADKVKDVGESAKDAATNLDKLTKKAVKMGAIIGALKGVRKGFSLLSNVISAATNVVSGFVNAIWGIGMSILAIPFKIFSALVDMSQKMGSPVFRQALEEVRKTFGDIASGSGLALKKSAYEIRKEFNKLSGGSRRMGASFRRVFGWGREGMAAALKFNAEMATALGGSFAGMREQLKGTYAHLAIYRKGLGFTADQTANFMKQAYYGGKDIVKEFKELAVVSEKIGDAFGFSAKEIGTTLGGMYEDVKTFGGFTKKEMAEMAAQSMRLGISLSTMGAVAEKFDDWDQASEAVSELNRVMGWTLNAQELWAEQDPIERSMMLMAQAKAHGQTWETMHRTQRKFLAEQTNIDQKELQHIMSKKGLEMDYNDVKKAAQKPAKKALDQAKILQRLSKQIERVFGSGGKKYKGFFDAFASGFGQGVYWSREFQIVLRNINRSLRLTAWRGRDVGRAFIKYFPGVRQFLGALADFFDPKKFAPMIREISDEFKIFFKAVKPGEEGKALDRFGTKAMKILRKYFGGKGEAIELMTQAADTIATIITNIKLIIWEKAAANAAKALDSMSEVLINFIDTDGGGKIGKAGDAMSKAFGDRFGENGNKLWDTIFDKLLPAVERAAPIILDAVILMMSKFSNYLSNKGVSDMLINGMAKTMMLVFSLKWGIFAKIWELDKRVAVGMAALFMAPVVGGAIMGALKALFATRLIPMLAGTFFPKALAGMFTTGVAAQWFAKGAGPAAAMTQAGVGAGQALAQGTTQGLTQGLAAAEGRIAQAAARTISPATGQSVRVRRVIAGGARDLAATAQATAQAEATVGRFASAYGTVTEKAARVGGQMVNLGKTTMPTFANAIKTGMEIGGKTSLSLGLTSARLMPLAATGAKIFGAFAAPIIGAIEATSAKPGEGFQRFIGGTLSAAVFGGFTSSEALDAIKEYRGAWGELGEWTGMWAGKSYDNKNDAWLTKSFEMQDLIERDAGIMALAAEHSTKALKTTHDKQIKVMQNMGLDYQNQADRLAGILEKGSDKLTGAQSDALKKYNKIQREQKRIADEGSSKVTEAQQSHKKALDLATVGLARMRQQYDETFTNNLAIPLEGMANDEKLAFRDFINSKWENAATLTDGILRVNSDAYDEEAEIAALETYVATLKGDQSKIIKQMINAQRLAHKQLGGLTKDELVNIWEGAAGLGDSNTMAEARAALEERLRREIGMIGKDSWDIHDEMMAIQAEGRMPSTMKDKADKWMGVNEIASYEDFGAGAAPSGWWTLEDLKNADPAAHKRVQAKMAADFEKRITDLLQKAPPPEPDPAQKRLSELQAAQSVVERIKQLENIPEELKRLQTKLKAIPIAEVQKNAELVVGAAGQIAVAVNDEVIRQGLDQIPVATISAGVSDANVTVTTLMSLLNTVAGKDSKLPKKKKIEARLHDLKWSLKEITASMKEMAGPDYTSSDISAGVKLTLEQIEIITGGIVSIVPANLNKKITAAYKAVNHAIKIVKKFKKVGTNISGTTDLVKAINSGGTFTVKMSSAPLVRANFTVVVDGKELGKAMVKANLGNKYGHIITDKQAFGGGAPSELRDIPVEDAYRMGPGS